VSIDTSNEPKDWVAIVLCILTGPAFLWIAGTLWVVHRPSYEGLRYKIFGIEPTADKGVSE